MKKIGERVKAARLAKKLSQVKLAKLVGVKQQSIQDLEKGKTKRPRNLEKLAFALGVKASWLAFGGSEPGVMSDLYQTVPEGLIPVIGWHQAAQWINPEEKPITLDNKTEFITSPDPLQYAKNLFALRIQGDAMVSAAKTFNVGSLIVVNPNLPPQPGDYVVEVRSDKQEALFRQFALEGGQAYLKPLNPQYPMEQRDNGFLFCGVVILHIDMLIAKERIPH